MEFNVFSNNIQHNCFPVETLMVVFAIVMVYVACIWDNERRHLYALNQNIKAHASRNRLYPRFEIKLRIDDAQLPRHWQLGLS
jgi:hypothetical protein